MTTSTTLPHYHLMAIDDHKRLVFSEFTAVPLPRIDEYVEWDMAIYRVVSVVHRPSTDTVIISLKDTAV